jgi:hypothetical protein
MSKLIIKSGTIKGSGFSAGDVSFEVPYNPTEYSVNNSNSFSETKIPGLIAPIIQFNQGNTRTLSIELLLDTYKSDKTDKEKEDLREKYIKPLEKLMAIKSDLHAPPHCMVSWGTFQFKGVLESLDKKYILFSGEGTPVRARVTLKFKEYYPLELQVKGTPLYSPDRRRLFKMTESDSIWQMAYTAYGDAGLWRAIAEANNIEDPWKVETGRDLIIPALKKENA